MFYGLYIQSILTESICFWNTTESIKTKAIFIWNCACAVWWTPFVQWQERTNKRTTAEQEGKRSRRSKSKRKGAGEIWTICKRKSIQAKIKRKGTGTHDLARANAERRWWEKESFFASLLLFSNSFFSSVWQFADKNNDYGCCRSVKSMLLVFVCLYYHRVIGACSPRFIHISLAPHHFVLFTLFCVSSHYIQA